jgi:hypothetical protein
MSSTPTTCDGTEGGSPINCWVPIIRNEPSNVVRLEDTICTVPDPTNPERFLRVRHVITEEMTIEAVLDKDGNVEWEGDYLKAMKAAKPPEPIHDRLCERK